MRAAPAWLLVVLTLGAAGCVGSEEGPPLVDTASNLLDPGPSAEELARMPGSIEGVVTTTALEPIGGATVTLLRENVSTTTDASGLFRFTSLPTTTYLLQARAVGFEPRTVQVAARNGTVMEVNVTLVALADVVPYHQSRELNGLLTCDVLLAVDMRREADCAAADPNHRDSFEFDVNPEGKTAVVELVWDTAANPGAKRLTLHLETVGYGAMDLDLGNATGEGYARLDVPRAVMEKYYPEGGMMRASVTLEPDPAAPAAAAAQTAFTVYVTVFYLEPGPDGFSVLSGA